MGDELGSDALKLSLTLRLGVTGHRALPSPAIPAVEAAVDAFLRAVEAELRMISGLAAAKSIYRVSIDGQITPNIRVVSPLAEGADRIVAAAGAKLGAELYFPLPFAKATYERDFDSEGLEEFRQVLGKGNVFELDGDRDDPTARVESYQAIGRFVVGCSDILIAIWNGKAARGIGGSTEIVSYAIQSGVPVWWIDESGQSPPKWLGDSAALNNLDSAVAGEKAFAEMRAWIGRLALPPSVADPEREGPLGALAGGISRLWQLDQAPIEEFFNEPPLQSRLIWRAYEFMMAAVAPALAGAPRPLPTSSIIGEAYWRQLHEAPDRLAKAYADRYRSSYVLIALLAFIALGAGAVTGDQGVGVSLIVAVLEVVAVMAITALVTLNQSRRWHERWITYRLLAELCRKQYALAALGRSLPGSDVSQLASDADDGGSAPRDVWVAWYFLAALRAAPFPIGGMDEAKRRALEVGRSLIDEQCRYHEARKDRSERAGDRIKVGSELFFGATIGFAIAKAFAVYFQLDFTLQTLVMIGAFLSAGAGALVGIRAYSEFSLLARQSAHMLHALKIARRDFEAAGIAIDRPLSSKQLGQVLYLTAAVMMQDITGWAQLFRIKNIEAG